jgi:DNA-binding protein H-NS
MPSKIEELRAQRDALDREIEATLRAERGAAIEQVRTLMQQYGLSLADLGGAGSSSTRRAGRGGPNKGGKVAPKYRNAATGESWTGRGLKPRWLIAALQAGRKIEEFAL